ncbi:MAG TPA: HDOD domain-containing protein [Solirubrobacteraceae bacterium]|nr:HDOD domain-containing protein [Solirubrobacteraceae bacterium]
MSADVFLARQPVLDRDQTVAGYELLYPRADVEQTFESFDDQALETARVALGALSEIGLEHLVGQSQAWINVAPGFLSMDLVHSLPPESVVLQLRGTAFIAPAMLELVRELREAGYVLALDGFRYTPSIEPLLALAQIVKLDMVELGGRELAAQRFKLRDHDVTVVAKKIESYEDFKLASAAGADLFQGFFFCRPHLLGGRTIAPSRLALMRLAGALQDPGIELSDIEKLISQDVALSYRLLKYINSAYFNLRSRISSLSQAVALLGIEPLRRWATLTTLAEMGDKPRELFVTALIRARFCQLAGEPLDGPADQLFMLGLFSVLDALTDTSMHTALQNLPLTPAMRDALVNHSGPGRLLDCVMSIETGDFERAADVLPGSAEHYLQAVAWSNNAGAQLLAA